VVNKNENLACGENLVSNEMNNLEKKYQQEIRPKLAKEFALKNVLAVPSVVKVVLNIGLGQASQEKNWSPCEAGGCMIFWRNCLK